jgi:RNA-directed DNA polymerase
MRGHYAYYGITGNGRRLKWYAHQVERIRRKRLSRRGQPGPFRCDPFRALLQRYPLAPTKIVHQYLVGSEALPSGNRCGKPEPPGVRDEGGNVLVYSEY